MPVAPRIAPLETLLQTNRGRSLPLPRRLQQLYGELRMPAAAGASHIYSNFVTSLDGVVSLNHKGHEGGGDISGFSIQDRMVMGLLRATADVVILGSGSVGADPHHLWTAAAICPELANEYAHFETALRKRQPGLSVIVSASGELNLSLPIYKSGQLPVLVVTTAGGEKRLLGQRLPSAVEVRAVRGRGEKIKAGAIMDSIDRVRAVRQVLVEGGPRLLGTFYADQLLDEQFLTLSPQIAGRIDGDQRPSLVMGQHFAPKQPLWGNLQDIKRGRNLLFLRYLIRR